MYFEIHKNNALRQYWWVVKAANHQTLATSEMYTTKQSSRNAIDVIATQAAGKSVYDKTGEA